MNPNVIFGIELPTYVSASQHNSTTSSITNNTNLGIKYAADTYLIDENNNKNDSEIEIVNLNLAIKKHNSLDDHDGHVLAPTTQIRPLRIESPTMRQGKDNIKFLVREREARAESLTLLLKHVNDTATNETVDTIRDGIEYFPNYMYTPKQYDATTSSYTTSNNSPHLTCSSQDEQGNQLW